MRIFRSLGLEANPLVKGREIEYTIYAQLKDMSQLESAPEREEHEQWRIGLKKDSPVKMRIRATNGRKYSMTTKAKRPGMVGVEEETTDVTQKQFEHLRETGSDGYRKTRYTFPITGTERCWEIDVFMDRLGKPSSWVKIDLEVADPNEAIPEFGLDVGDFIIERADNTPDEERKIRSLWDTEWLKLDQ
jgi:hypothetical protein